MHIFFVAYLSILSLFIQLGGDHPFHVSTQEIEYNVSSKVFEIATKCFIDDFENACSKQLGSKIDLHNESMHEKIDQMVRDYFLANCNLEVGGRKTKLNYLGFELENDIVWVFCESEKVNLGKSFKLTNTLMYNIFDDQMSIVHLRIGTHRSTNRLAYPEKVLEIKL